MRNIIVSIQASNPKSYRQAKSLGLLLPILFKIRPKKGFKLTGRLDGCRFGALLKKLLEMSFNAKESLFKCHWFKRFLQLFGKKTETDMEKTVDELKPELEKAETDLSAHVSKEIHNVVKADSQQMAVHWLIYSESSSPEAIEQLDTIHRNLDHKFNPKIIEGICQKCKFNDMMILRTDRMPQELDVRLEKESKDNDIQEEQEESE